MEILYSRSYSEKYEKSCRKKSQELVKYWCKEIQRQAVSHRHDYVHVAFQNRLELPPCWEICLQIDVKSSMETKME